MISLDWMLAHHERGPQIYDVTKGCDYVQVVLKRVLSHEVGVTSCNLRLKITSGLVQITPTLLISGLADLRSEPL